MSFTYTSGTARGRVRRLISDTDDVTAANQMFDDGEIDDALALEDNEVYAAAASLLESMAALSSRSAIRYKAEKIFEIDRKDMPKHFRELAAMYRKRSIAGPGEEIDAVEYSIGAFGNDGSEYIGDVF